MTKKSVILLGLLVIGLGGGIGYSVYQTTQSNQANYLTTTVTLGDIEQTALADGRFKAFKQVNVGAQVSGQIKHIAVELGQTVEKGDLVAIIDDLPQTNQLKEAQANLKNIEAQITAKLALLRNQAKTVTRLKAMRQQGASSQADYDTAQAQLDAYHGEQNALQAQLTKAKIALDTAQLNLSYTRIEAPLSGIVVALPVEEGQTVNAMQTIPNLMKIAQLDTMTVEAQISEADVAHITRGMPIYFTTLGDNQRHEATLRTIEPAPSSINQENYSTTQAQSNAIYYNGLFDVANKDHRFRIDMTAQVNIILAQAKNVLKVPIGAIKQRDSNPAVDKLTATNDVVNTPVTLGISDGIWVEVTSGLKADDTILLGTRSATLTQPTAKMKVRGK